MNITIETFKTVTKTGRGSGRIIYTYLVDTDNETVAIEKAKRTHARRIADGDVPQPPKGRVGARRDYLDTAADYVIR